MDSDKLLVNNREIILNTRLDVLQPEKFSGAI